MPDEQVVTPPVSETPAPPPPVVDPPLNETADQKYNRLYGKPTDSPTVPVEVASTLAEIQNQLAALRAPAPQTPPATPGTFEWVEKIRSADYAGAQAALATVIQESLRPELERVKQEATQKAYTDALATSQVVSQVEQYLQTVRSSNPDIIPFERYLQGPVQERLELAKQAGRIPNPAAFLREYRAAVDAEVTNFRNLGLQLRAAGKDEATTRTSDVLHSTPLTPQQVQSNQSPQGATPATTGESNDDYFARRRMDEARRRGLG